MATPTPTPPAGGTPSGTSAMDYIIKFFKGLFGFDLNAILTLAAPQIRRAAEEHAKTWKKNLPSNHPLRGDLAEIVLNEIASRIETASEGQPKAAKAILEKISDFIEIFASDFCTEEEDGDDAKTGKKASQTLSPEDAKMFAEMYKEWLKRASELIASTHAENMGPVIEQLKVEAIALADVKEALINGRKKEPEPEVPFRERMANAASIADEAVNGVLAPINRELEQGLAKWEAFNQARKQKMQARILQQKTLLGKAWEWLSKP